MHRACADSALSVRKVLFVRGKVLFVRGEVLFVREKVLFVKLVRRGEGAGSWVASSLGTEAGSPPAWLPNRDEDGPVSNAIIRQCPELMGQDQA